MFKDFWQYVESVSDPETKTGWVDGFEFGEEANAAVIAIAYLENAIKKRPIIEEEIADQGDVSYED